MDLLCQSSYCMKALVVMPAVSEGWQAGLASLDGSGPRFSRRALRMAFWRLDCGASVEGTACRILSSTCFVVGARSGVVSVAFICVAGDMNKFNLHCKSVRGSMKHLLQLHEVPSLSATQEAIEKMDEMRQKMMPEESEILWAVQNGNEESRQAFPAWVGSPMGKAILKWMDEMHYWNKLCEERRAQGKGLTPCQQKRHDEWKQTSDLKLLFDKGSKKLVPRVKRATDLRMVHASMFSLQVELHSFPDLRVKVGTGESLPLVMLRGEPAPVEDLPFEVGLADEVLQEALQNQEEEDEEVPDADVAEQAALVEEECQEIMAHTSDEELLDKAARGPYKRVKTFCHRQSYLDMEAKGYTMLPTHVKGVFLSYHRQSRMWQGCYPEATTGMCFSHGGTTNRALAFFSLGGPKLRMPGSESEALVKAVQSVLERYLLDCPKDEMWRNQLERIRRAQARGEV